MVQTTVIADPIARQACTYNWETKGSGVIIVTMLPNKHSK